MACRRHKGLASSSVSEHPSSAGACPQQSRRVGFCLLLACAALINSDQNLLAPNMSACARDFGFSAQEKDEKLGGTLAAGLFLAGAPAALAVGAAADGAMRRVDLLAVVLGLGAVGCLATAFARSFWWLFAARALTGVSLGGGLPVTMSLLGDFFDPTERALMSSRLGVAMSVGQMAGQALAGSLGPELGWRAPFLVVGALMLLLTCSIAKLMAEPARDGAAYHHRHGSCGDYSPSEATAFLGGGGGGAGGAGGGACAKGGGDAASELSRMGPEDHQTLPPPANASLSSSAAMERGSCSCGSSGSSGSGGSGNSCNGGAAGGGGGSSGSGRAAGWLSLFAVPTVWLLLLQGVPGCVPWGVISAFLPDFLHVEYGLSVPSATFVMTAFSLGGIAGQTVGGAAGQALYNRSSRLPALLMLVAGALGVLPMWGLLTARGEWSAGRCAAAAALGGFFATQTGPNVRATLINVTQSEQRGLGFAAFALADDLGKGVGPVLIAALVARLGRERAFAIATLGWLPCALLCACTACTVVGDEARARASAKRARGQLSTSPAALV